MEQILSSWSAYAVMALYAAVMLLAVRLFTTREVQERESFIVHDRDLSVFRGGMSIAVSWIWAPAIFFCGVKAYTQGVPGAFWFIVPNVICFATFAVVAQAMRRQNTLAVSLPDYMLTRFQGDKRAHLASLVVATGIDVVALLFNTFIGAFLLNLLAGIPTWQGMVIMMLVALAYSSWRGLPASVVTDVVQLGAIVVIAFVITPWVIAEAGGASALSGGFGGASGNFRSVFNAEVAYSFGIPSSLALLSVPLADQMFYQRAMAVREGSLVKTFLLGGAMFALVPVMLSLLGFVAASPEMADVLANQTFPTILVNAQPVQHYLPTWTLTGFVIMAICALSSTLDSALCALASIWGQDIYAGYINPEASEEEGLQSMRWALIAIGLAVMMLAILLRNQLNGSVLYNFNGVVASAIVPAVILAVFWKRTTATAVFAGTVTALLFGAPLGWWANVGYHVNGTAGMVDYVVLAAAGTPTVSFVVTATMTLATESNLIDGTNKETVYE